MVKSGKVLLGGLFFFTLCSILPAQTAIFLSELNDGLNEARSLSVCGSTVMFGRIAPNGEYDIYEGQWSYPHGGLTQLRRVEELNLQNQSVSCPRMSLDGLRLYYDEMENNLWHIRVATRDSINDNWTPGRILTELQQPGLNSVHQSISSDELTIYWDEHDGHILTASRSSINDVFTNVKVVTSVDNSGNWVGGPGITPDQLTMYYCAWDPIYGNDMWKASRSSISQPFGNITRLSFNSTANDWNPYVSPDGNYVYFYSDRNGQKGIWMAAVPEPATVLMLVLGGKFLLQRQGGLTGLRKG